MKGRQRKLSMNTTRSPGLVVPILSADILRWFASQWMANELRDLSNYDGAASAYELWYQGRQTAQLTARFGSHPRPGRGISRRPFARVRGSFNAGEAAGTQRQQMPRHCGSCSGRLRWGAGPFSHTQHKPSPN